jgi:hypothetical protein
MQLERDTLDARAGHGFFEEKYLLGWITTFEVSLINSLDIEGDHSPLDQRVGPLWRIFIRELAERRLADN